LEIAQILPTPHETVLIFYEEGKENKRKVQYNAIPVKPPGYPQKLHFVVVKGFGIKPMTLLTSCEVNIYKKESIWRIVEYYLARWKCDESYRYIKQCYNLEDIRAGSYISIRNIVVLVPAISYFAAVYIGRSIKLEMLVERIFLVSKRFFGCRASLTMQGIKPNAIDDFQLCFEFG
jgi:hypothetical protein